MEKIPKGEIQKKAGAASLNVFQTTDTRHFLLKKNKKLFFGKSNHTERS